MHTRLSGGIDIATEHACSYIRGHTFVFSMYFLCVTNCVINESTLNSEGHAPYDFQRMMTSKYVSIITTETVLC